QDFISSWDIGNLAYYIIHAGGSRILGMGRRHANRRRFCVKSVDISWSHRPVRSWTQADNGQAGKLPSRSGRRTVLGVDIRGGSYRGGFDVGVHTHRHSEEFFYVLEGELELLAFEPAERTADHWHDWESAEGEQVVRVGPGSCTFVPRGCPHE